MADEEKKSWLSCLGWGCLGALVVSAVGIGGCVATLYKGGSAAHSVARAYLESVDTGRFEEAFETLGPSYIQDRSLAEFVAFEKGTRARLGSCGDWRLSGTSMNRAAEQSTALLTYRGLCEAGPMEVTFSLAQVDKQWVIQDIRYNESGAPVIPACADCGTVLPPEARFCPSCGSEIDGAEVAPGDSAGGDA